MLSSPRASSSNESYRGRGGGGWGRGRGTMRESTRERKPITIGPYDVPRDSKGDPVSVPLRFELIKQDGAHEDTIVGLKDFFQSALRVAARDCNVKIDEMGEIRVNPMDGMRQSRWVCHFKMSCADWQSSLSQLMRQFHFLLRNDRTWLILNFEIPIVYTHSTLLYPLRLINVHRDISFRRVKFGSFLNSGAVGIHWNIEGGFATAADEMDGYTFYKDIDASFEYDRKQITIFFHNRECKPEDRNMDNPQFVLATYKVTINMSSIRKIGLDSFTETEKVDPEDYGTYCQLPVPRTHTRRSLVLTVEYPPKIQVKLKNGFNNRRSNGNNRGRQTSNVVSPNVQKEWSDFEHRLEIRRGRYPGEVSDCMALHDSKLIVLEFDEEYLNGKLDPPNSTLDQLSFDIASRLRHKTGKAVEYTSYDQIEMLMGRIRRYYRNSDDFYMENVTPYELEDPFDDYVRGKIGDASRELVTRSKEKSVFSMFDKQHHIQLKAFRIHALLEGILQRGMDIRCQLLTKRDQWYDFVDYVCGRYASNEQMTLHVLENLLSIIFEGRPHCSVWNLFDKEWTDCRLSVHRSTVFTEEDRNKGFTRVMKFVITPTRLIFVGYETIMANRVLNQHSRNGTEIVRVSFRDDSGEYMREMSCGSAIISDTMRKVLMEEGFLFAGRVYSWLGNSNSQLRDHGYYAFHESDRKTAREIRRKLGNFHNLTSIPKWLARQGQCFTQARASDNNLPINQVGVKADFIGGKTDTGKPYCFSDGVGTIAFSLAYSLSKEHALPRTASAFQIRHKGQKGLVAVDPNIDARNKLLEMMNKKEESTMVYVRPSMDKFEVEETSRGETKVTTNLEIVKYSMPSPLFLCRPLLNILSQVSEDQSAECHKRMSNRIEDLLDIQLRNTAQSLYIEQRARETIKEMSFPFAMEVFSNANPLKITSEPFLTSLLRANSRFVLHKQLAKMQIRIPNDLGRSMFGVVDTTGILQYGQIFCQYSTSTSKHMSRSRSNKEGASDGAIILKGPVMMTKNPCIEKGDVRRFEAIDVPGLRHNVDVVVFPMHGPRPHPDEMAGSDLDGDEYSLIWDSQLLFDHNEEASLFPSGEDVINWPIPMNRDGTPDINACEKRLGEFYIEAVTQEQIGVLSNAHLATSDFHGLDNPASRSLAWKISQSLDFQKNGTKPDKMTERKDAIEDPDDETRMIPPEKAVRKPDYMEKMRDPVYESRGIMGSIYREIKRYQHAMDAGDDQMDMIEKDPSFDIPGWDKYKATAMTELETFSHGIKTIMEYYGISSEGELMSGQIVSIKNRISEKEADDMNLFNTNMVIEDKVKREITAARIAFFKPLINWEDELEQVQNKRRDVDENSILCRIIRSSTSNMEKIRLKAAACYNVCYDAANQQLQNGEETSLILSFPWIFYDVLADIKLRPDDRIVRVLPDEDEKRELSNEPLAITLSSFIDEYCEDEENGDAFTEFKTQFEEGTMLRRCLDENDGLARASFVLVRWAIHLGGIQADSKFKQSHLVALFIQFGLGEVMMKGTRRRYIQRPSGEVRVHLKKGEHLLKFIDFVASREFRTRDALSFGDIMAGVLLRGEWRPFSELIIPAYLVLVTSHRIDLPMREERDTSALRSAAVLKEFEPRKMELPEDVIKNKLEEVRRDLMRITFCRDVQLRPMGGTSEVFVSAIGTSANFKKLNELVISPAPPRNQASTKALFYGIPRLVYERLCRAAAEAPSISSP